MTLPETIVTCPNCGNVVIFYVPAEAAPDYCSAECEYLHASDDQAAQ